jgi:diadenosine tetraphosphate (Ap4A) HIT family hydrolase
MNETIKKFGYPASLVGETDHWVVMIRPKQITMGCLVLAAKSEATSLGAIEIQVASELPEVCAKIENMVRRLWPAEKFNYLALMMVDPYVHFHVIPRYASAVNYDEIRIADPGWPSPPDLKAVADLTSDQITQIADALRQVW